LKIKRWNKKNIPIYFIPEINLANYGKDINKWIHDNKYFNFIKVIKASKWNSNSKRFESEGFAMTAERKRNACAASIDKLTNGKVRLDNEIYKLYDTKEEADRYIDKLIKQLLNFQCIQDNTRIITNHNSGKITGKLGLDGISRCNDDLAVCFMLGILLINEILNPNGKLYEQLFFIAEYLQKF